MIDAKTGNWYDENKAVTYNIGAHLRVWRAASETAKSPDVTFKNLMSYLSKACGYTPAGLCLEAIGMTPGSAARIGDSCAPLPSLRVQGAMVEEMADLLACLPTPGKAPSQVRFRHLIGSTGKFLGTVAFTVDKPSRTLEGCYSFVHPNDQVDKALGRTKAEGRFHSTHWVNFKTNVDEFMKQPGEQVYKRLRTHYETYNTKAREAEHDK